MSSARTAKPRKRATPGPRRRRSEPKDPAAPASRPWEQPQLMMESMALADAVYQSHSRRLLRVLTLCATLLLAAAIWVALSGTSAPTSRAIPLDDCALPGASDTLSA